MNYRNYTRCTLYRSCLLIHGIAIIVLFLFLDDFEGNANISVAIKSGSTRDLNYSDLILTVRIFSLCKDERTISFSIRIFIDSLGF